MFEDGQGSFVVVPIRPLDFVDHLDEGGFCAERFVVNMLVFFIELRFIVYFGEFNFFNFCFFYFFVKPTVFLILISHSKGGNPHTFPHLSDHLAFPGFKLAFPIGFAVIDYCYDFLFLLTVESSLF
jgi:hypothetical protein